MTLSGAHLGCDKWLRQVPARPATIEGLDGKKLYPGSGKDLHEMVGQHLIYLKRGVEVQR